MLYACMCVFKDIVSFASTCDQITCPCIHCCHVFIYHMYVHGVSVGSARLTVCGAMQTSSAFQIMTRAGDWGVVTSTWEGYQPR